MPVRQPRGVCGGGENLISDVMVVSVVGVYHHYEWKSTPILSNMQIEKQAQEQWLVTSQCPVTSSTPLRELHAILGPGMTLNPVGNAAKLGEVPRRESRGANISSRNRNIG